VSTAVPECSTLCLNVPQLWWLFTKLLPQHPSQSQQVATGARHVLSASCEVTRQYVSDLFNVTAKYLGLWQKGRMLLLYLTSSSGLASLLLRWKAADTVFVVLSFSFQVWRHSPTVAMSLLNSRDGQLKRVRPGCVHAPSVWY